MNRKIGSGDMDELLGGLDDAGDKRRGHVSVWLGIFGTGLMGDAGQMIDYVMIFHYHKNYFPKKQLFMVSS